MVVKRLLMLALLAVVPVCAQDGLRVQWSKIQRNVFCGHRNICSKPIMSVVIATDHPETDAFVLTLKYRDSLGKDRVLVREIKRDVRVVTGPPQMGQDAPTELVGASEYDLGEVTGVSYSITETRTPTDFVSID